MSRLLWPGVGRMALEEARRLPARLLVYRQSRKPLLYDPASVDLRYLRANQESGRLTPLFRRITALYNSDRGPDATIDLDLIFRASGILQGPVLYHDQFAGLTGYLRKLRSGAPYAIYLHETALGDTAAVMNLTASFERLDRITRRYDRTVLRHACLVFTNSRFNQRVLADEGIRSTVLYPGCEPVTNLPDRREPMILATSVWERTRRPDWYAELARRSGVRVVLAGIWAREEEMQAFVAKQPDNVTVTGPISEAALRDLSIRSSLYVRFGFGERGPGQGGIQALAFGLPVVSNRGLAMSELLTHGVDGFIVDSIDEAVDAVKKVLSEPARLRGMSAAAWDRSRSLSWDSHASLLRSELGRAFPAEAGS